MSANTYDYVLTKNACSGGIMAEASTNREGREDAVMEKVSLTVVAPEPGGQDIQVEIKRQMSSGKRRSQRRMVGFLLTVMFLMLFPMARDGLTYFQMSRRLEVLQLQNQELVSIQEELDKEMKGLHSLDVIEQVAREELNMVRPGESKVFSAIPTLDIPQRENLRSGEALH